MLELASREPNLECCNFKLRRLAQSYIIVESRRFIRCLSSHQSPVCQYPLGGQYPASRTYTLRLVAFRETQVRLESSSVELGVDGIDLHSLRVRLKVDDTIYLELVAPNAGRPPAPADLVAGVEHAQSVNHWQWRRLGLAVDVGLLAWIGRLAELCHRKCRQ